MTFERKITQETNPYKRNINVQKPVRNIYWGEVISIDDPTEGGRIKVRIPELDTKTPNDNLPDCYPLMPKFFHVYPQVGEVVRIILEDTITPQRSRFWVGSVISQLQNINFDGVYTSQSTTNIGFTTPERAISEFPNARGVFPEINEIALIGRDNTDVILKNSEVQIRAGKHERDNILELNKTNPATMILTFEDVTGNTQTRSTSILLSDKIALISHDGIPKFRAAEIDQEERERIINNAHPMVRGDFLVNILEIFRNAIINHIHPYSTLPSDQSGIIVDLENINLEILKQNNILIN